MKLPCDAVHEKTRSNSYCLMEAAALLEAELETEEQKAINDDDEDEEAAVTDAAAPDRTIRLESVGNSTRSRPKSDEALEMKDDDDALVEDCNI